MKKIVVLMGLALMIGSIAAQAGEKIKFPKIDAWKLKVNKNVYNPGNLWDLINGGAGTYVDYGFVDLHLADYKNKKKGISVHVEIYKHGTPENAYGIYASERSVDYTFLDIGAQAYKMKGILNLITGEYYVKIYSTDESEAVDPAMEQIAKEMVASLGQENKLPCQLSKFPTEGAKSYGDAYIIKSFLGHDFLKQAFTMEYQDGYSLFFIETKDEYEAKEMAGNYLNYTEQSNDLLTQSPFVVKDEDNGDVAITLAGKYLIGILNGADNKKALQDLKKLEENLR